MSRYTPNYTCVSFFQVKVFVVPLCYTRLDVLQRNITASISVIKIKITRNISVNYEFS